MGGKRFDYEGMAERTFGKPWGRGGASVGPQTAGAGVAAAHTDFHVGPPVAAVAALGQLASGRLWSTVRWTGSLTLLVGPGVTLVLDAASVAAIHHVLSHALAGGGGDEASGIPGQARDDGKDDGKLA